jgi:hypothetical protein
LATGAADIFLTPRVLLVLTFEIRAAAPCRYALCGEGKKRFRLIADCQLYREKMKLVNLYYL